MPDTRDDDALLRELHVLFEDIDPVPPEVTAAAVASLTWRTIDAELAELVDDSVLSSSPGIRSSGGPRLVTFEAPELSVVVEVAEIGSVRHLLGQLVPPQAGEVDIRHPSGSTTVQADELGRFTVEGVPGGPVSLVCRLGSGRDVATSWVSV
jgi:hypothetical protein